MPSDTAAQSPAGAPDPRQLRRVPMFYHQPAVLEPNRHGAYRFKPLANVAFAKPTNCVPIMAGEFGLAQRDYPIVFTKGEQPAPVIVVGLGNQDNLFVDAAGKWRDGTYVPSYVRRYPFIFIQLPAAGKFALCIDEASGCLSLNEGQNLFEANQPTQLVQNAVRFCGEFQQEFERTQQFCAALQQQGLLVERSMKLKGPTGQDVALDGFQTIDEVKFNALPDQVILEWRQRGWLGLVYAQFMSSASWRDLGALKATAHSVA